MKVLGIVQWVFLLIGSGLLIGAFHLYHSASAFIGNAARADGVVVDLTRSPAHNGGLGSSTTYRPVVRFFPSGGRRIEFVSSMGSNPPAYARGDRVTVLYASDNPRNAMIDGFFSRWGGTVIVGGMGMGLFVVSLAMIGSSRSRGLRESGPR